VKISHIDYSDLSEVARTKSGKRAAVKPSHKPAKVASRKCPTGKVRLKDHKQAVHSLHRAKGAGFIELENNGSTTRQECRTYFCVMCKGHHLTSKREWTTHSGQVAA
jgi:hypothetical protein